MITLFKTDLYILSHDHQYFKQCSFPASLETPRPPQPEASLDHLQVSFIVFLKPQGYFIDAFNNFGQKSVAMTSSKARKDLPASLRVPDMSGLVFATLELTNEAGRRSATALGRNYSRLSDHHRQYLRVDRISKLYLTPSDTTLRPSANARLNRSAIETTHA